MLYDDYSNATELISDSASSFDLKNNTHSSLRDIFSLPSNFSDSRAFKMAVSKLSTNPIVQANFGQSPDFSFDYANGFEISDSGVKGEANFAIKIIGNEKSGLAYVVMYKSAGIWKIEELNLLMDNEEPIVLIGI